MERPSWHNWQILHALRNNSVTTDLLFNHVQTLLADMSSLLCFVHGNANRSQVHVLVNNKNYQNFIVTHSTVYVIYIYIAHCS